MSKPNWSKAKQADRQRYYANVPPGHVTYDSSPRPQYQNGYRQIVLRYAGRCTVCSNLVRAGAVAFWRPDNHAVRCSKHAPPTV